jgi:hypothetical protein
LLYLQWIERFFIIIFDYLFFFLKKILNNLISRTIFNVSLNDFKEIKPLFSIHQINLNPIEDRIFLNFLCTRFQKLCVFLLNIFTLLCHESIDDNLVARVHCAHWLTLILLLKFICFVYLLHGSVLKVQLIEFNHSVVFTKKFVYLVYLRWVCDVFLHLALH